MVKRGTLILAFCLSIGNAFATTYYTVADGAWSGNIWSTTQNGPAGALPSLNVGDVLVIYNQVTITSTLTITPRVTVDIISNTVAGAQLNFQNGRKLTFSDATSVINLSNNNPASYPNPQINGGGGGGNSDYIKFGTVTAWQAGDGNISGVGQLNQHSNNGSLPIKLIAFSVIPGNKSLVLQWATASELNFNYFLLEKSGDGKTFIEITRLKGNGTTSDQHNYSYEDNNPIIGKSYYRLTSVDFDGYTEVFPVVLAMYNGEKDFHVSPNPTDGSTIGWSANFLETDLKASLTIYDDAGSQIGTFEISGANKITLNAQLKSGIYLIKYSSSTFTKTARFLVR